MNELPQLHVIGLGIDETAQLAPDAIEALQQADLVVGSPRQLQTVAAHREPLSKQQVHDFKGIPVLKKILHSGEYRRVAILASGDPLYYGIGRWCHNSFPADRVTSYPGTSSIQGACHRLGLSQQDIEVLSLHGRPVQKLRTRLRPNQPLLILTDKHSTPWALARICRDCGFDQSRLTVVEALGYPQEQVRSFSVEQLIDGDYGFDPLHLTLIEPAGDGWLPRFPGIADHHFITDGDEPGKGMISKREVRLSILSLLQLAKGERVWDIGAGCGGVAVELAYWQPEAEVVAIEQHPQRLDCLRQNRERFGVVANLEIIEGRAPEALEELAVPDKVFVGGSDGELAPLLDQLWQRLPEGGVLVASAVTEPTRAILSQFSQKMTAQFGDRVTQESVQLGVARGESLAGQLCFKPNLPVVLFRFQKTAGGEHGSR
ncbi:precorrin-6y C5,15-methyltransferase (decarboxylating) subunit CbiE [Motiliproteus coralliicola]|uniref:Precorrin-6y C5,15-methyltransferase (Decarboxylating) subunit CbiE n=1 Tax=Motiliproteus coralliicola TaxID=2283196 RepID=A0A369W956_9GAMM|nr:precorrin-6y C5,15-methyltransferase (decarboxylating) subunit CbiE [Motiliproteus coralliicola]RDE18530.1 precorrin-6y C5,15-methyltransferase (decarboxylating) subunit CbiE [Motiliproteus coralliicola]